MATAPDTQQPVYTRWLVPLLLLAPIVAIFAPVLFADRSFAFRDGAFFYHPLFQWITSEWGQGRVPLWNPLENCGLPVLADATSSIFYPGKLIFVLPLPFAWLYKFYVIGHVVLAALSMYAFARRLQASQQAAVLAAIAYACGGNVLFQYCNIVFLIGAAWLPAALLGIEEIVRSRCRSATVFLAFVLAMMILGGDPQMAYHALLAAGLRLVIAWFSDRGVKTSEQPSLDVVAPKPNLMIVAVLLGGSAVIAFLLAAIQIFPSSETTKFSERAAYNKPRNVFEAAAVLTKTPANQSVLAETPSEKITAGLFGQPEPTSHHDRAYDYSVSPWRVIEFVWPNISGRAFPQNQRWLSRIPGDAKAWTPTMYLGLLPLLVGVAALRFRKADPTTRWLTWLVVIFALGSLGWYGLGWLLREGYASILKGDSSKLGIGCPVGGVYWLMLTLLPTYVYFRYPAKLMVVAVCGVTAAAAPATDRVFAAQSERWLRTLQIITGVSLLIAFGVWCASPFLLKLPTSKSQIFGPFNMSGALFDVLTGLVHTAVVAGLLYWIFKQAWETNAPLARWKWAAVALTATELAVANAWLIFTAPAPLWTDTAPVTAAIQQHEETIAESDRTDPPRFFRGSYFSWHDPSWSKSGSPERMEQIARWDHDTLSHKYSLQSGYALVESYGSLKLLDYESLLLQARVLSTTKVDGVSVPAAGVLRLTGCDYLVLPESAVIPYADKIVEPGITLPENVSLWRMKRTQPRAMIVHHVEQLPPLTDPLDIAAVDERSAAVLLEQHDGKNTFRDFRQVAIVETSERLLPELTQARAESATSTSTASIVSSTPHHIRVKASLTEPGLLVLADSWAPGWVAFKQPAAGEVGTITAERQPLTIHRANRCFRGVELPAGDWFIDFEYRPQSFYRGAIISAVAWIGLLVAVVVCRLRRRV